MYEFRTKKDVLVWIHPLTKILMFITTNMVMLGIKSYRVEAVFFLLLIVFGVMGKCLEHTIRFAVIYYAALTIDILLAESSGTAIVIFVIVMRVIRMFLPIYFSAYLLVKTSTMNEFLAFFQNIHLPVSFSISFAVMARFVPTVKEEAVCIFRAMAYRGISCSFRNVVCHLLQVAEYILVPLLISSVNTIDELAAAVMTRGFDLEMHRTNICEVKLRVIDVVLLAILIAVMVIT